MSSSFRLPFDEVPTETDRIEERDRAARERAVDPRFNVALEASAGTGKTRVLVDRYVNLLRAGIDPSNILAITFTRKAAAEMRERILSTLRAAAERGELPSARWRELRDRTADINISTIDAFCLSLLREFPLEADLDPGFSMADDMEVPRLVDESLDRALRTCRGLARDDETVALVFAQLGERRARAGLTALLNRRIVAKTVLDRFLERCPVDLTVASASARAGDALLSVFRGMRGGIDRFIDTGPPDALFVMFAQQLRQLEQSSDADAGRDPAVVHATFASAREYFLTQDGKPRSRLLTPRARFGSAEAWAAHRDLVVDHARNILGAWQGFRRDLNALVSRGVRRMFAVAETEYRRTLDAHAVLDFHDVLLKALQLLRQMEEFAQSRYRLEARYHHVLVDEFQDTSRAQWELIELLIASWGEGLGLAHTGPLQPSVFIVGDRKQSIYGFRDADVSMLRAASRHLEALRPDGDVRRSISRSFRSVPALLAFINDLCAAVDTSPSRGDAFRYEHGDRFPVEPGFAAEPALGLVPGESPEACAELVAAEIARLVRSGVTIRDRETGVRRPARAGDVAILFRTRESHREFEEALEKRGIPAYVYKGLGFFDADEIRDVLALLRYLAEPTSDVRAAALLRSGFGRISDEGLRRLAPHVADAIAGSATGSALDDADAATLAMVQRSMARWRDQVDRIPTAELLDRILEASAYAMELRGPRLRYARENLKKIRALVRRIQNRGYATLARIANHLDRLAVADEPNAVIDALDAVNLMTVHAAKGLEFPVVFVVNLARGTGNRRDAIRIAADQTGNAISVAVGDYRSDADEDETAREREETKRLLYVAVTRARDLLYLSSALKDGAVQPGRGSLADVMPPTLLEVLTAAYAGGAPLVWSGQDHVHRFNVVASAETDARAAPRTGASSADPVESDFEPIEEPATARRSPATVVASAMPSSGEDDRGRSSDLLAGLLVHRLVQRFGITAEVGEELVKETAIDLLRQQEVPTASDRAELARDVLARFQALRQHPVVRAQLESGGDIFHEVPFTSCADGQIARGTIDCLIRQPDGSIRILEFKTGRRREDHTRQAETYQRAAAAVFPGSAVVVDVVYATEEPAS